MTAAEDQARRRDGHYCRRCGRSILNYPSSLHHRQPKGMGGGSKARYDKVENLVRVCGTGTDGCHLWVHTAPERYDSGFLVHSWDDPATVPLTDVYGNQFVLTDEGTVIPLMRSRNG